MVEHDGYTFTYHDFQFIEGCIRHDVTVTRVDQSDLRQTVFVTDRVDEARVMNLGYVELDQLLLFPQHDHVVVVDQHVTIRLQRYVDVTFATESSHTASSQQLLEHLDLVLDFFVGPVTVVVPAAARCIETFDAIRHGHHRLLRLATFGVLLQLAGNPRSTIRNG
ncbi:hypothetical protein D3C73_1217750 [compost metagenome]